MKKKLIRILLIIIFILFGFLLVVNIMFLKNNFVIEKEFTIISSELGYIDGENVTSYYFLAEDDNGKRVNVYVQDDYVCEKGKKVILYNKYENSADWYLDKTTLRYDTYLFIILSIVVLIVDVYFFKYSFKETK